MDRTAELEAELEKEEKEIEESAKRRLAFLLNKKKLKGEI
jgi:hypothetical protein